MKDTDYLYASTRVRAREAALVGREKLLQATDASGAGEINILIDGLDGGDFSASHDKMTSALAYACKFTLDASQNSPAVKFLLYKYDCNNVKTALKCFFRNTDAEDAYFPVGTVPPGEIKKMPAKKDYTALPENMAKAAEEAYLSYVKTSRACDIDRILDKACFADMARTAKESGEPVATALVAREADLKNIMMCLRVLRRGGKNSEEELRASLITVGTISTEKLLAAFGGGEKGFCEELRSTPYHAVSDAVLSRSAADRPSLAELEKICDDLYLSEVAETKFMQFGAPVLFAYLVAVEYEIKNLRIVLAGKLAGLSADDIKMRLRNNYV